LQSGDLCSAITASVSPKAPKPVGTQVTLSGSATCEADSTPDLRYSYRADAATSWTVLEEWGNASSVVWNTTSLPPGLYKLRVDSRAPGLTGAPQGIKVMNYTLSP
jgi:hypothetical protein